MNVKPLFKLMVDKRASDLFFTTYAPVMIKIDGKIMPVNQVELTPKMVRQAALELMNEQQLENFTRDLEIDFAISEAGLGRFRVNVFHQRGNVAMVLRFITPELPQLDALGMPDILKDMIMLRRGLILMVGASGSGKSTTLAAMIDYRNKNSASHIVTIEDPIEYLHRDNKSIINQREIGVDTNSFSQALRSALRQDPDVILVGEMRDYDTIQTALTAAETGHLVLSTLHTMDATESVNRIIAVFPPHQQKQIRLQLASVLRAVVSQRLMPRTDAKGRVPAVEVLRTTGFIKDCIVDKERTHLIHQAIAQGTSQYGMQTFDQSIFGHHQAGLITLEEALRWATNVNEFKLKVQGIGSTAELARDSMAATGYTGGPEITRFG
jgi:twitching motility protein PilT